MAVSQDLITAAPDVNPAGSLDRRTFVAAGAAAVLTCAAHPLRAAAQPATAAAPAIAPAVATAEARTRYGSVRGLQGQGLVTFRGIPYGGKVSGAHRFKAAPPPDAWTGVRDALQFGSPSLQPGRSRPGDTNGPAEDCLFLNIWTPAADGRKRPVMFYSHGGGYTTGSANSAYQDGGNLARTWDVVVVATNHRLGLLGYLYLGHLGGEEYATSGNQGILDIRDGLRWVHENIASFGGDPENVMIFGESGGGGKTSTLYAMPSAEPYFNKASIESGPGLLLYPRASAIATTSMVLDAAGIAEADWRKLLDVPAAQLLDIQTKLGGKGGGPLWQTGGRKGMTGNPAPGGFGPMLDGKYLPHDPFSPTAPAISKNKPLIAGYNHDEMNFFFAQSSRDVYQLTDDTLRDRLNKEFGANGPAVLEAYRKSRPDATPPELYVAIATARFAGTGEIAIAERKAGQHGAPAFAYVFTHASDALIPGTQTKRGAAHASEIAYKFDNVQPRNPAAPAPAAAAGAPSAAAPPSPGAGMMGDSSASSVLAARNMSEFWSTFARTGRPSAAGQPAWPAYNLTTRPTMLIDSECKVANDPTRIEREMWERVESA